MSDYQLSLAVQSNDVAYYFHQLHSGSFVCVAEGDRDEPDACVIMHQYAPDEIVSRIRTFFGDTQLALAVELFRKINAAELGFKMSTGVWLISAEKGERSYLLKRDAGGFLLKRNIKGNEDEQRIPATFTSYVIVDTITEFYGDDDVAADLYQKINAAAFGFEIELL